MMLQGPRPPADEVVAYNAESGWAEAWVGEGGTAFAVYIHMNYSHIHMLQIRIDTHELCIHTHARYMYLHT